MHFCYRRTIYPTEAGNFSNVLTRQITQEDTNLLLTKTTTARCSQEAVMTSHVRK